MKKNETIYKGSANINTLLTKLSKKDLITWAQNEIKEWKKFIKLLRAIKSTKENQSRKR